jgi:hypothetical protein
MATTHTPLLRATVSADAPPVSLNMIATPITRHSFPTWISRLDQDASGNGPIPAMCLEGKRERPRCRHLVLRLTRREAARAGKQDRPCMGPRLRQQVGNQTRWASLMSKTQNMERGPAMAVTMGRRRQICTGPNLRSRHENKRTPTASEKRLNDWTESRNKAGLPSTREADPKERANAEQ